jgi:hypothetical protein
MSTGWEEIYFSSEDADTEAWYDKLKKDEKSRSANQSTGNSYDEDIPKPLSYENQASARPSHVRAEASGRGDFVR